LTPETYGEIQKHILVPNKNRKVLVTRTLLGSVGLLFFVRLKDQLNFTRHEADKLHNAKKIFLKRCPILTDQDLVSISIECPKVTHLKITHANQITNYGLAKFLKNYPELEMVSVHSCAALTNEYFNMLPPELFFLKANTSCVQPTVLPRLVKLTEIQLFGQPSTEIFEHLAQLSTIHTATLRNCEITSLGRFQNIVTMNLHNVPITPDTLLTLVADQQMLHVNISGITNAKEFMTHNGIWNLSHPTIEEMCFNTHKLHYTGKEKKHFSVFTPFPNRTEITLGGSKHIFHSSETPAERKITCVQGVQVTTRRTPIQWTGVYHSQDFTHRLWADTLTVIQNLNLHQMTLLGTNYRYNWASNQPVFPPLRFGNVEIQFTGMTNHGPGGILLPEKCCLTLWLSVAGYHILGRK